MTPEPMNLRGWLQADLGRPALERPEGPAAPGHDLDGVRGTSEPTGLDVRSAPLSEQLPAGTALLCVKSRTYADEPNYQLDFYYRGTAYSANQETDLQRRRPPDLGLHRLAELAREIGWRATYRRVKGWWKTEPTLIKWVDWLERAEDPRLVVWDQTAFEIPWELLYRQRIGGAAVMDAAGGTGGWIGAGLPVIRWTTVWDGDRAERYDPPRKDCRGGVLVYEDKEFRSEHDGVGRHEILPRSRRMEDLRVRLERPRTDFGLLLLRCHGIYSEDPDEFMLGDVSLPELSDDWAMPALYDSGAAVLISSCVSARTVEDHRYNAAVPCTFAEVFLRWGAGAVIATLAKVSKGHAHDFAARLLTQAQGGPVGLAEAVTDNRAFHARWAEEAIRYGDATGAEEAIEAFFAGFTFAYFGHPGTTLALEVPQTHPQACAGGESA
ncbi:hypothetical protein ABZ915_42540 [Streptomyces sp. NPDC046915]|uniref:hypothetical protein n=1 Tax=Streptomyces sp. NPDC046915 TaxID=3155257 RepID=UPI0033F1CC29